MKKSRKGRTARPDDGMRQLVLDIHHNELCDFGEVCQQDGMKLPDGIRFLIRWAIGQNTLCPMTKAEDSLAVDLLTLHKQLTNTLNRVRIAAGQVDREDDEGEEWKKGGAS